MIMSKKHNIPAIFLMTKLSKVVGRGALGSTCARITVLAAS